MIYQLIFSRTGRSENVMKILSENWRGEKCKIDLSDPYFDGEKYNITDEDFCIFATSVYEGRIPKPALKNLKALKGNGAKALLVAVFGNRAQDDCLLEMRDEMTNCGFVPVAAIEASVQHSIVQQVAADRPDRADIAELKEFAQKVQEKLASGETGTLQVPGNYPYLEMAPRLTPPVVSDECIMCGLCAKKCPVLAIDPEKPNTTDGTKCIHCLRCTEVCPVGARSMPQEIVDRIFDAIKHKFEGRKPNKLYL